MKRQLFVASTLAAALGGCAKANNALNESGFHKVLESAEGLNHVVIGSRGRAKTYPDSMIDRQFRLNGFDTPSDALYQSFVHDAFGSYRLVVDGEVERKAAFTLGQLRGMRNLTEVTRHDCVEGWSAIGKWSGVRLGDLLARVRPTARARYVVFYCMDRDSQGAPYYESLDLGQASHPQTVLALDLNDRPLDADHGAPVRLRVPTQLGYKSAKWVRRIELRSDFAALQAGKGGYWEDAGYEWYAGI